MSFNKRRITGLKRNEHTSRLAGLELPGTDVRVVDVDNQPLEETINGAVYLKYTYSDNSGDMKTLGILLGFRLLDVKKELQRKL